MTEQQWAECDDPYLMMGVLLDKGSERKVRLFGTACCRRIWHLMLDPRGQAAVEVSERFADGRAGRKARARARAAAAEDEPHPDEDKWEVDAAVVNWATEAAEDVASKDAWKAFDAALLAAHVAGLEDYSAPATAGKKKEKAIQAGLLRCIFGDPFRLASVDPGCLTLTVARLARAAYEERLLPQGTLAPERLAVLADAVEEAGCTNPEVLSHLRGPGPHVRGCWAVDLLLGNA
jgi:hypothetical protein